jgi:PAS domain S-box-containing protein
MATEPGARFSLSSLRVRLLLLVFLAVLPALALILYTHVERRRLDYDQAQADALRLSRLVASTEQELIHGARQLLVTLAHVPAVRRREPGACGTLLRDLLKEYPAYASLGAVEVDGRLSCSSSAGRLETVNLADRAYLHRALQTRDFAIGQYELDSLTGKATIGFAYPILDEARHAEALVTAAVDVAWLSELLAQAQLPPGSSVNVIDSGGTMLARYPDPERWVGRSVRDAPLIRRLLDQRGAGIADVPDLEGVPRLYAFSRLTVGPDAGEAYLSVGIPKELALADADRALRRNLFGLGVVAILAMGAAWIVGDLFILRRVQALVGATRRLAAGDLSARSGVRDGRGELNLLARAFDDMAESLQARQEEAARASRALAESEARIRGILESALDAVIAMDHEGRISEFNPAAERVFGYSRNAVVGQPMADLIIPPALREQHRRGLRRYLETGEGPILGKRLEITAMRADGTEFPVELAVTRVPHPGPPVFTAYLRDVSERKRAERALREAFRKEQEHAAHLKGLAEAAVAMNAALSQGGVLHVLAGHARVILGAHRCLATVLAGERGGEPLDAMSVSEQWAGRGGADGAAVGAHLHARVARAKRPVRLTRVELEADPECRRAASPRGRPLPGGGWLGAPLLGREASVVGVIEVSHKDDGEFTQEDEAVLQQLAQMGSVALENSWLYREAQEAEERLRGHTAQLEERVAERTAALRETNAELESFSYSVSHDLRAPLRAMQGFASALLEDYGPRLEAAGQDYARRIVSAARRMDALIQDLLVYSRVSRSQLEIGAVSWRSVVEAAQTQLDAELREREARVTVEEPLRSVTGHQATLVQVTANLLGNAIKFVPPGTAPRVRVWTEARGQKVRCWVEDNGMGIAPEHQERIFGIFERLHSGDRYPGTGIGLAIVRKGVERMGGRVGVESTPGEGSRFWVELEAAESAP